MDWKEFFKPTKLKIFLFLVCFVPLFALVNSIISLIFQSLLLIIVNIIRIKWPGFNFSWNFFSLAPLILGVIIVYALVCKIELIYKKNKNKKFLYIISAIGILLTIGFLIFAYILLSLLFF
jgi:hypothetical protein